MNRKLAEMFGAKNRDVIVEKDAKDGDDLNSNLNANHDAHCDVNYDHSYIVDSLSLQELDALTITMAVEPKKRQFLSQIVAEIARRMSVKNEQLHEDSERNFTNYEQAINAIECGKLQEGLIQLISARKSSPRMAQQFYDKAITTLIKQRMTQLLKLPQIAPPKPVTLSATEWLTARCPARVDLYGGWSDTPPITYENGGCVVNFACTVNGEKPIGARLRSLDIGVAGDALRDNQGALVKIRELGVDLQVVQEVELRSMSHMKGYDEPFSPGNLVKGEII